MSILISEDISKVVKNKNKLERFLNVKIIIKEKEISVEGPAEDEYIAEKVIDAINFGFPISVALLIKNEDFLFEILDIKKYTHRKDLGTIRARIIGKNGKTLKTLTTLTECNFELKDNDVGIIGSPECIKNGHEAIIMIVQGSKQANVYAFLEKHQVKPVVDLGLKEKKKKSNK
jgi:KH domain-containing protein